MGLTKFIYFTLIGWKIEGGFDPTIKKSVLIVAPHTSSMDFLLSVLVRRILKLQINFVGKKELFSPPWGWYFRWMGGAALDRISQRTKFRQLRMYFPDIKSLGWLLPPRGHVKK